MIITNNDNNIRYINVSYIIIIICYYHLIHVKIKKTQKLTLFIDVVKMNNLYGHEYVYINNEYKKKNVTPITIISDHNGLALAYRHLDYSKKFNKRRSHEHEIKNVQKTLNEIKLKCPNYIDISLTGDKAYISNITYNALSQKIKLTTPKRKNQKIHG